MRCLFQVAVLGLLLAGCHQLLPYGPQAADRQVDRAGLDQRGDRASVEGAGAKDSAIDKPDKPRPLDLPLCADGTPRSQCSKKSALRKCTNGGLAFDCGCCTNLGGSCVAGLACEMIFYPTKDTFTAAFGCPSGINCGCGTTCGDTPLGSLPQLGVYRWGSGNYGEAYLDFSLFGKLPSGASVKAADLKLRDTAGGKLDIVVEVVTATWMPATLTFASAASLTLLGGGVVASLTMGSNAIPVPTLVVFCAADMSCSGFRLRAPNITSVSAVLDSSETVTGMKPTLVVTLQ